MSERMTRVEILQESVDNIETTIEESDDSNEIKEKLSPHQKIAAYERLRGIKEQILDIQEAQESRESARSSDSFGEQLRAQEIQIRCLEASLKESTTRTEDLKETLDAMRGGGDATL